eukprot:CAMPEP_0197663258 /NCGR_PEP_ID=MMETSP1338-20131121/56741_1 /TAXON_ID=43686 ORGANISM="Pelagodinium beii, Strain RCC1491" /NCGR_SAMPLE_ID=MMETSP1338 /ASSEMBLY_ACC=CAM_ASM_000754 /LENGTH=260 /DNA_ID=CAMNT_0043241541 /DNA_START=253 /DNA_END=1035 /DNA_ORIENTATION=+
MREYYGDAQKLERYFSDLFLSGTTSSALIQLSNVTDVYFLGQAERSYASISYDERRLVLPATSISGANIPWMFLIWLLPVGAGLLLLFILSSFLQRNIWSFESAAYLQFSWDIGQMPQYKQCVYLMAAGPLFLPLIWLLQIILYDLEDQIEVLKSSVLSGLLLLFALDHLAHPGLSSAHEWHNSEFLQLHFQRPILHLLFVSNKNFGLKLVDALWAAEHGDWSRLQKCVDADDAKDVLRICQERQKSEVSEPTEKEQQQA